jgi:hypothetical protein
MSKLIKIKKFSNSSGSLNVIEKNLPFKIKRVFFIYDIKNSRGNHGHKKTLQAITCLQGRATIEIKKDCVQKSIKLTNNTQLLLIDKKEWIKIHKTSKKCIIIVLASEYYDKNDFFY